MSTTHRHVFWTNADGKPCEAYIVRRLGDGRAIVRFTSLPPRVIMPATQVLPLGALVPLVSPGAW